MVEKFLDFLSKIINAILFLIYLFAINYNQTFNYNIIIIISILIFNNIILFNFI